MPVPTPAPRVLAAAGALLFTPAGVLPLLGGIAMGRMAGRLATGLVQRGMLAPQPLFRLANPLLQKRPKSYQARGRGWGR